MFSSQTKIACQASQVRFGQDAIEDKEVQFIFATMQFDLNSHKNEGNEMKKCKIGLDSKRKYCKAYIVYAILCAERAKKWGRSNWKKLAKSELAEGL